MSFSTADGGPVGQPKGAAFARNRLIMAKRRGLLPSNFNVAQTGQNAIGQFHMLNPGIAQGMNGNRQAGRERVMQGISQLGDHKLGGMGHNMVDQHRQPHFGAYRPQQGGRPMGEQLPMQQQQMGGGMGDMAQMFKDMQAAFAQGPQQGAPQGGINDLVNRYEDPDYVAMLKSLLGPVTDYSAY